MPELPEVETVCTGLNALIKPGTRITNVVVRQRQLRYPIPTRLSAMLHQQPIRGIQRRAKYLIWDCGSCSLINHLGMTGSWRQETMDTALRPHDHCLLQLANGQQLIYHDPRRFGMLSCVRGNPLQHRLLAALGPEPLDSDRFDAAYLYQRSRGRRCCIKQLIMDQAVVVGVGNIYASESLYRAGIAPRRPAGRISRQRLAALVTAIRTVLQEAINAGGSTISDFRQAGGSSGYFQHQFAVYERAGEACHRCQTAIKQAVIGQRSSYWCPQCQR